VLISLSVGLRGETGQRFAAAPTSTEYCPLALFTIARPQQRHLPTLGSYFLGLNTNRPHIDGVTRCKAARKLHHVGR